MTVYVFTPATPPTHVEQVRFDSSPTTDSPVAVQVGPDLHVDGILTRPDSYTAWYPTMTAPDGVATLYQKSLNRFRETIGRVTTLVGVSTASSGDPTAGYAALARNPDALIAGAVTRDSNGAATSAPVVWPDGTAGTYTALVVSSAFPGAVDSYKITYGSTVTKTYTQPTVTRDATGAATNVPAIAVS